MQHGQSKAPLLDVEAQWIEDQLAQAPQPTVDQLERVKRVLASG